LRPI